MRGFWVKFGKMLAVVVGFLFLTLALAELGLRSRRYVNWQRVVPAAEPNYQQMAMDLKVRPRIDRLWDRKVSDRAHPFEPPFPVFVNRAFDDAVRMEQIFMATPLASSGRWLVPNFLRAENEAKDTVFKVTSNSLGFRGPERSRKKPPRTFRIIVLGSYPAFGHGVSDEETYSSRLEQNLNRMGVRGLRFEVWNGGRQGGTGIMGLARLMKEIPQYEPDLLLWDYGWIDFYLRVDQVSEKRLRVRPIAPVTRSLFRTCGHPSMHWSELCREFNRKMGALDGEAGVQGWREANRRMIEFARKAQLPVVLVRHRGVKIEASEFEVFANPKERIFFLDTSASFDGYKVTPEDEAAFWSKRTWLDEIGIKRQDMKSSQPLFRGDAIQYGALGYRIIGDALTDIIAGLMRDNAI